MLLIPRFHSWTECLFERNVKHLGTFRGCRYISTVPELAVVIFGDPELINASLVATLLFLVTYSDTDYQKPWSLYFLLQLEI